MRFRLIHITGLLIFFFTFQKNYSQIHNEVISYKTNISIENNVLAYKMSVEIQISDRAGENLTKVEIPFTKKSKIRSLNAWIEDFNGNIVRKLDKKDFIDISAISDFSLYEDDYVRKFELRHNEYPYKICYSYEQNFNEFLHIADWSPVFSRNTRTRYAELSLETDTGFRLNVYQREISNYKTDIFSNKVTRTWISAYEIPYKVENYALPFEDVVPGVTIMPEVFFYGIQGSAKTWNSFGNWQYRLNEGLDVLPAAEKVHIDNLVENVTDKKEIAKILYHHLQISTRYINVSIDIGGFKPYPAEYVVSNKYGDCKALTNYMKAMLTYVGIPSFYTKILAGEFESQINMEIPGPWFNHIILTIPFAGDTVWLDCTNNTAPFGYPGTFNQNRSALLVDENKSKLIKIPVLKPEEVLESSVTKISVNMDGDASVNYLSQCRGKKYEDLSSIKNQYRATTQDEILKEYNHYFISIKNPEIQSWKIDVPYPDSAFSNLAMNISAHGFAKKLLEYMIFNLPGIGIPYFEPATERKLPVYLPYPVNKTDTAYVNAPSGYSIQLLSAKIVQSDFGNYSIACEMVNNSLKIIRHFELHESVIPVQNYSEFYGFIKSALKEDAVKIILNKL